MLEKLKRILDVFSRRNVEKTRKPNAVPTGLRNRILLLCADIFSNQRQNRYGGESHLFEFWQEIYHSLLYIHGRLQLSNDYGADSEQQQVADFLLNCSGDEFLDFVELIFKVDCLFRVQMDSSEIVDSLNELFKLDNAPYQLTPFVKQEEYNQAALVFNGMKMPGTVVKTIAYPKIIMAEEIVHSQVIKPVLEAMSNPIFNTANLEYRDALEDYKKNDYGDCLTKCGSAFESVMKIICNRKGWTANNQDTAAPLLRSIMAGTGLESYYEQPLLIIATLRNRLSKAHGAGVEVRNIGRHIAEFCLITTAASILLLIGESKI